MCLGVMQGGILTVGKSDVMEKEQLYFQNLDGSG